MVDSTPSPGGITPEPEKVQVSPIYQAYQTSSQHQKGDILLLCTEECIKLLDYYGATLRTFSSYVLQRDLATDQRYARELSAIQMVPVPPGDTASHHTATLKNTQLMNQQQIIQAQMKAAQSNEQRDLMDANATTSNSANTTAEIQALQGTFVQIVTAIAQMCR